MEEDGDDIVLFLFDPFLWLDDDLIRECAVAPFSFFGFVLVWDLELLPLLVLDVDSMDEDNTLSDAVLVSAVPVLSFVELLSFSTTCFFADEAPFVLEDRSFLTNGGRQFEASSLVLLVSDGI